MLRRVLHAALASAIGLLMLLGVGALADVEPQGPVLPQPIPTPNSQYINAPNR